MTVLRRFLVPAALVLLASCSGRGPAPVPVADPPADPSGLHNFLPVGDGLWSGSNPEGDAGFQSLRDLGVRTLVSVDGARPDVDRAHKFGLRYAHVPVAYGGITQEQVVRLVKAGELPGPIYVHCHHGKHRGPTAAALMRLARADGWTADDAVAFLARAGTDRRYEGLYANPRAFRPPTAEELAAVPVPPEAAGVGGLAAIMVGVDETWDRLTAVRANGWAPPAGATGSAAHPAVQLGEHYREAARLPEVASRPEAFRRLLGEAERAAGELEAALRTGDGSAAGPAFDRSARLCATCHREFRDRGR